MADSPERIERLLAQLRDPKAYWRNVAAKELSRLPEGSDRIARALSYACALATPWL